MVRFITRRALADASVLVVVAAASGTAVVAAALAGAAAAAAGAGVDSATGGGVCGSGTTGGCDDDDDDIVDFGLLCVDGRGASTVTAGRDGGDRETRRRSGAVATCVDLYGRGGG